MALPKVNPTKTKAWKELQENLSQVKSTSIKDLFKSDENRFKKLHLEKEGLLFDYSKNLLNKKTIDLLLDLANETRLKDSIKAFQNQEVINETENQKVLHAVLRCTCPDNDSKQKKAIIDTRIKMKSIVENIHSGIYLSHSKEKFTDVVNIGIGGSSLGPEFVINALRLNERKLNVHFLTNIDPQNAKSVLENINLDKTIFIVASKSFKTAETISNFNLVKEAYLKNGLKSKEIKPHFIAVTNNVSQAKKEGFSDENILKIPDGIGGRYSIWSSVGLSIALTYGYNYYEDLLKGAHKIDEHFFNSDLNENLPVILALVGVWNVNFLNLNNKTFLPYDSLLSFFPDYLQQLVMESNGKNTDRLGEKIDYATSPIYWGGIGTNSQHSFFQLLHQGKQETVVEFLLPKKSNADAPGQFADLQYNCLAQSAALAFGGELKDLESEKTLSGTPLKKFRKFVGNMPNNVLIYEKTNAETIGKLISLYEHQTFVQGIIWNIFSFDQWGVELSKNTAINLRSGYYKNSFDNSTKALLSHINRG